VLLEAVLPDVDAVNEPGKIEFGAPGSALIKGGFPIGYVETKRLGRTSTTSPKANSPSATLATQTSCSLNYLEFRFYKHGEQYGDAVTIADGATGWP
jgi:hypothetical protein